MPVSSAVCGPPGVFYSGQSANCSEALKVWERQGVCPLLAEPDYAVRFRMVRPVVYAVLSVVVCSVLGSSSFSVPRWWKSWFSESVLCLPPSVVGCWRESPEILSSDSL